VVPAEQIPCCPVVQPWPPPGLPLSTVPLQSSSRPLQISLAGFWLRTQLSAPEVHVVVPAEHTPSCPVTHAPPPPGLPLSTAPLQSSSRPLHVSTLACWLWLQTIAPEVHAVVPAEQMPCRPVEQLSPPPGLLLSTTPLQSLSLPSHTSALDCTFWLQWRAPAVHAVVPAAQTPCKPVEHATLPPGLPLSTVPSQSSSRPLHVSLAAAWLALHTMDPLVHAVLPAEHTPCLPVEHETPPPGLPLSMAPLQSSSSPLHVSAEGCTFWLQTTAPLEHAVVPAEQTPSLPVPQLWPPPGLPLSTTPSQSSSSPLHVSPDAC
jgi:hypothetical protein